MPTLQRAHEPLWLQLREQGAGPDDILRHFGISEPPVPVRYIASKLGIRIHPKLRLGADGKMFASLDPPAAEIWIDAMDPEVRQRFTLAHEIGHLMMHPLGEVYRGGGSGWSRTEREANHFAANLLMPEWMVRRQAVTTGLNEISLSLIFDVSSVAMSIQLGDIFPRG